MNRYAIPVAAAVAALGVSACTPALSSAGPAAPSTGGTSPAAAYITSHPVPARPGMASGILTAWSATSNGDSPASCDSGQKCWSWRGTVVEAGGQTVQIGYRGFGYDCPGQVSWPPAGEPNGALNDYIYFETSTDELCPPAGVIVIEPAVIGAGG